MNEEHTVAKGETKVVRIESASDTVITKRFISGVVVKGASRQGIKYSNGYDPVKVARAAG